MPENFGVRSDERFSPAMIMNIMYSIIEKTAGAKKDSNK